jgi:predicted nucleotidyltransferase
MQGLNLSEKLIGVIYAFIKELQVAYGEGLVSVILYGSAASGEFTKRHSNVNILVVLDDASLDNLKNASGLVNRRRYRSIKPLFLSEEYIRNSTDVFPIEFLDMKENYSLLFGKDILANINIDLKNLRFQCEQELKSKLLNIRNLYIRDKSLSIIEPLLFRSFTSLVHIMRNLLRIKGKVPPYNKQDILDDFTKEFGLDTAGLSRVLSTKNSGRRLNYSELNAMLVAMTHDLEKIAALADAYK